MFWLLKWTWHQNVYLKCLPLLFEEKQLPQICASAGDDTEWNHSMMYARLKWFDILIKKCHDTILSTAFNKGMNWNVYSQILNKGNNKITEFRTIFEREKNSITKWAF
jgi:hypothetical protein